MGFVIGDFDTDKVKKFAIKADFSKNVNNQDSYNHCVKADALRIQNYYFESVEEYLNAIDYDCNNPEAFKGMAMSYTQIGYTKSAIESFNRALE
ncbi:MAG: hypothetical protein PHV68_00770 [Candidatus Gastranaerophilales bacterium]|nr:hypothetical protein [Candidatus Gastranaerophilales bacterium]